jgi:hypothetical protein
MAYTNPDDYQSKSCSKIEVEHLGRMNVYVESPYRYNRVSITCLLLTEDLSIQVVSRLAAELEVTLSKSDV